MNLFKSCDNVATFLSLENVKWIQKTFAKSYLKMHLKPILGMQEKTFPMEAIWHIKIYNKQGRESNMKLIVRMIEYIKLEYQNDLDNIIIYLSYHLFLLVQSYSLDTH